jgi:hypothetical protein
MPANLNDSHGTGAHGSAAAAARDWLTDALVNPRGKEAASMTMRSSLQDVVNFLVANIGTATHYIHRFCLKTESLQY